MLSENKKAVFPIILRGLLKNSKAHWNQTVQSMTLNVIKSLMEIDGKLFEEVSNKIQREEDDIVEKEKSTKSQWDLLAVEFS